MSKLLSILVAAVFAVSTGSVFAADPAAKDTGAKKEETKKEAKKEVKAEKKEKKAKKEKKEEAKK